MRWHISYRLGVASQADYSESELWGTFGRISTRIPANERENYKSFRLMSKT